MPCLCLSIRCLGLVGQRLCRALGLKAYLTRTCSTALLLSTRNFRLQEQISARHFFQRLLLLISFNNRGNKLQFFPKSWDSATFLRHTTGLVSVPWSPRRLEALYALPQHRLGTLDASVSFLLCRSFVSASAWKASCTSLTRCTV